MKNFDINKSNQVIDGKFIGYHNDLSKFNIKKGDVVTIKKGTVYHTMKDGEYYETKKTHKVKVDHLISGSQYIQNDKLVITNTLVCWAGTGGYWHRVDINDVL